MIETAMHALDTGQNVGVLVPSANPVVEPELNRLLPPALRLFAARLPAMPGTTLHDRNRRYAGLYAPTLATFNDLPLAAVMVAMTGPSYSLLPQGDQALAATLSHPSRPVQTASGALAEALATIGARRLCLVSPYPQWLTDEATAYWQAAGHHIHQVVKVGSGGTAYTLASTDVMASLATIDPQIDAIVISGTGLITLPAIVAAHADATPKPLLSSNIAAAWWLMRATATTPNPLFHAAAPALAASLTRTARTC